MSVWAGSAFALNTSPYRPGPAGRSNAMAHGVRGPLPDAPSVPIWLPAECVLTRDGKNPRLLGVNLKLEVCSPLSYLRTFAIDVMLLRTGVDNVGLLFRQKANGVCITVMIPSTCSLWKSRGYFYTERVRKAQSGFCPPACACKCQPRA